MEMPPTFRVLLKAVESASLAFEIRKEHQQPTATQLTASRQLLQDCQEKLRVYCHSYGEEKDWGAELEGTHDLLGFAPLSADEKAAALRKVAGYHSSAATSPCGGCERTFSDRSDT